MIDTHYDLLTILYIESLNNDFSYTEEFKKNFNKDNVNGIIANLYFMKKDEMKDELGIDITKEFSVVDMFKKATDLFKEKINIDKVLFSIEGCDYIKDESELEELYNLGLRNILLVWNNKNKYGSGIRSDNGLTEEGKRFLRKAMDLGISIDLSHMNKNTFWDTINLIKEEKSKGNNVKVIASHSNCYSLCQNPRNLDDDQIKALKEVGGIMSLVSFGPFVDSEETDKEKLKEKYIKHIQHAVDILGLDNVSVATDDMNFTKILDSKTETRNIFDYKNIKEELTNLLKKDYNEEGIEKILYKNIKNKYWR